MEFGAALPAFQVTKLASAGNEPFGSPLKGHHQLECFFGGSFHFSFPAYQTSSKKGLEVSLASAGLYATDSRAGVAASRITFADGTRGRFARGVPWSLWLSVRNHSRGSFPILCSHRSFQQPAVSPGVLMVFWKEGSLERLVNLSPPWPWSPRSCFFTTFEIWVLGLRERICGIYRVCPKREPVSAGWGCMSCNAQP